MKLKSIDVFISFRREDSGSAATFRHRLEDLGFASTLQERDDWSDDAPEQLSDAYACTVLHGSIASAFKTTQVVAHAKRAGCRVISVVLPTFDRSSRAGVESTIKLHASPSEQPVFLDRWDDEEALGELVARLRGVHATSETLLTKPAISALERTIGSHAGDYMASFEDTAASAKASLAWDESHAAILNGIFALVRHAHSWDLLVPSASSSTQSMMWLAWTGNVRDEEGRRVMPERRISFYTLLEARRAVRRQPQRPWPVGHDGTSPSRVCTRAAQWFEGLASPSESIATREARTALAAGESVAKQTMRQSVRVLFVEPLGAGQLNQIDVGDERAWLAGAAGEEQRTRSAHAPLSYLHSSDLHEPLWDPWFATTLRNALGDHVWETNSLHHLGTIQHVLDFGAMSAGESRLDRACLYDVFEEALRSGLREVAEWCRNTSEDHAGRLPWFYEEAMTQASGWIQTPRMPATARSRSSLAKERWAWRLAPFESRASSCMACRKTPGSMPLQSKPPILLGFLDLENMARSSHGPTITPKCTCRERCEAAGVWIRARVHPWSLLLLAVMRGRLVDRTVIERILCVPLGARMQASPRLPRRLRDFSADATTWSGERRRWRDCQHISVNEESCDDAGQEFGNTLGHPRYEFEARWRRARDPYCVYLGQRYKSDAFPLGILSSALRFERGRSDSRGDVIRTSHDDASNWPETGSREWREHEATLVAQARRRLRIVVPRNL